MVSAGSPVEGRRETRRGASSAGQDACSLIEEAFLNMYERMPITEIGVEQLAREAGYSRAAFYRYFHSVHDVLVTLQNAVVPQAESDYLVDHATAITPALFIQLYLDYFDRRERELRILLSRDADGSFYDRLSGTIYPAFYAVSQHIKAIDPAERDRMTAYLVESKMNQLRSWANNPEGKLSDYMRMPLQTVEKAFWEG